MRKLALFLGRHAARVIEPIRPTQAAAMYAEIETLEDRKSLGWALGCVAASYRQRASVAAVGVVSTRLCVAAAAGAFGLLHIAITGMNLWLKITRENGAATPGLPAAHTQGLDALPFDYWLGHFAVLGLLGGLHTAAAAMMAVGRYQRVVQIAIAIAAFELLMTLMRWNGLTLPGRYLTLTALLAASALALDWLWRWDERRLARR